VVSDVFTQHEKMSYKATQLPPPPTQPASSSRTGASQHRLSEMNLDEKTVRTVLQKVMDKGLLCPETLEPRHMTDYDLKKHGMFQLPPNLSDPEFLAEGGFGTVAKCRVVNPAVADGHETVAVKRVKITKKEDDWEDTLRLLREVHFLKYLPHRNVSPLLQLYSDASRSPGAQHPASVSSSSSSSSSGFLSPRNAPYDDYNYIYLVMPCYQPGSLDEFAINEISMVRRICSGLLRALAHMHKHQVLHRDVKRENIFFDRRTREAVLADFGMARSTVNRMTTKRGVGTRCYLAPEQLQGAEDYDGGVDVFGFGCVLFELVALSHEHSLIPMSIAGTLEHRARLYGLAGKDVHGNAYEKVEADVREKSKKPAIEKWCENRWRMLKTRAGSHEEAIVDICLKSLAYDPAKRWSAEDALAHSWLVDEPPARTQSPINASAFEAYDLALRELPTDHDRIAQIRRWILDVVADRDIPLPRGVPNPLESMAATERRSSAASPSTSTSAHQGKKRVLEDDVPLSSVPVSSVVESARKRVRLSERAKSTQQPPAPVFRPPTRPPARAARYIDHQNANFARTQEQTNLTGHFAKLGAAARGQHHNFRPVANANGTSTSTASTCATSGRPAVAKIEDKLSADYQENLDDFSRSTCYPPTCASSQNEGSQSCESSVCCEPPAAFQKQNLMQPLAPATSFDTQLLKNDRTGPAAKGQTAQEKPASSTMPNSFASLFAHLSSSVAGVGRK